MPERGGGGGGAVEVLRRWAAVGFWGSIVAAVRGPILGAIITE